MSVTIQSILKSFLSVVPLVFPVLFAVVLLVFLWGVVRFLWATSVEGKAEGKAFLFWGVIAMFVVASVWGLVGLLLAAFGVQTNLAPHAPELRPFQR
ncbi:MAG: hypothetical protein KatS3mg099_058 [Candidatus Parcubacteria bacterium]|nr:MAG: hypothetical protein KatS3mg099_058 [Candidatus Parcubacteria bacterium]